MFLTTHDYFIKDVELLDYLMKVYNEYKEYKDEWAKNIRLSVITVLKVWMNKYLFGEFGDKSFDQEFQSKYHIFVEGKKYFKFFFIFFLI